MSAVQKITASELVKKIEQFCETLPAMKPAIEVSPITNDFRKYLAEVTIRITVDLVAEQGEQS